MTCSWSLRKKIYTVLAYLQIGLFQYGGSSIIGEQPSYVDSNSNRFRRRLLQLVPPATITLVAFEPHRITFDEDLRKWSKRQIEVHSKVRRLKHIHVWLRSYSFTKTQLCCPVG